MLGRVISAWEMCVVHNANGQYMNLKVHLSKENVRSPSVCPAFSFLRREKDLVDHIACFSYFPFLRVVCESCVADLEFLFQLISQLFSSFS